MTSLTHDRARVGGSAERAVVVASVPSSHVYVRHLAPEDGGGPLRLPDPRPDDPARSAVERWWPPVMLDAGWAATADFDLMHLHFGFDSRSPAELEALVATLRRRGKPLVFTVHDLRNPHHESSELHDAQLDVLVPAADQLITLTPGAAREIAGRWGREAVVLPHPHVVGLDDAAARRRARTAREPRSGSTPSPFRVGVHLKSLRPSMAPHQVLPTLVEAVADLPGAVLQVNAHHDVVDPGGAHHDDRLAGWLRERDRDGDLELVVHDYWADARHLWDYLASLDVSVLPYRFGTHSGWLEACRDLGTTVVAPSCGYYAEQGPVLGYVLDEQAFDPSTLAAAVARAHRERPRWGATTEERRAQRREVARRHDLLYRSVLRAG
ncbi:glycosyltransferase [Nocardioides sp. SYSU D00038]|uniref:glycosyltransferase n=1 Tax=Nocardioides sp. SYSU D00038 TaxID=2812554 RepID=UPI0019675967|nr:glycosyltransferase [Nocardioides sp. SYSU D00038]